ncbi:MAG: YncE family protein, partial [Planctomycetota bacterium]|nr:YncE family protein [Planctomycetota bacterium]
MNGTMVRLTHLLLLMPLIGVGTYLSIRTDQRQSSAAQMQGARPPVYWKPIVRETMAATDEPHDLKPAANPNPDAPGQPYRYHPLRVVASSDGRKAYVSLQGAEIDPGREVAVVDLARGKLLDRIAVGSSPGGMTLHPGGRFLVVLNRFSNYASVIDTHTDEVAFQFPMPYYCQQLVFNRAGTLGYVTNSWKNQVLMIDVRTDGNEFEARRREIGGFSRTDFLGYHSLAEFDRNFAKKLVEAPPKEGEHMARCSRCGWAGRYPEGESFQCQYCGVSQDFHGRVIKQEIIRSLSRQKVTDAIKKLPMGVNYALRARCGTAGCHSQPVGGFLAGPDLEKNFRAAVANSVPGDGEGSHLLRVGVPAALGGYADSVSGVFHPKGGVIFKDPANDPDYQAIKLWIDEASESPGISVGHRPDALALSKNQLFLYVANSFDQSISVVDIAARREIRRIYTQSVVTDVKTVGPWLIATSLGAGFGAPKKRDPDGRESPNRYNPLADFSLWRDPSTGAPLPISRQEALGPFAHVDGTKQEGFRDISNDLIVINLEEEAEAIPEEGRGWWLDVSRYKATNVYTRYAADSFEALSGDEKDDVPPELMKVVGAHPEQMAVWKDRMFVVNSASFEVAEYRLNFDAETVTHEVVHETDTFVIGRYKRHGDAEGPMARLIPVASYKTGLHPRGLAVLPGGKYLLTSNFYGETLSVIDRESKTRKDIVVGNDNPRFPATDAERGELYLTSSVLSSDGDQSCIHCHFRGAGDGKAWSVGPTKGTNWNQTEERFGGSQKVPSCLRNLFVQVPLFVEGVMSLDETLPMMMEQTPLADFIEPLPGYDYTRVFCPREKEKDYFWSADSKVATAPQEKPELPEGVRTVDLLHRRDMHFKSITEKYWGTSYGIRDLQKFVGDFQAAEPRLLPNPNAQGTTDDPEVRLGRDLFFSPEVGCASCHPSP